MDVDGTELESGGEKEGAAAAVMSGSNEGVGVVGRVGPATAAGSIET
jgi:hypothetical protein